MEVRISAHPPRAASRLITKIKAGFFLAHRTLISLQIRLDPFSTRALHRDENAPLSSASLHMPESSRWGDRRSVNSDTGPRRWSLSFARSSC